MKSKASVFTFSMDETEVSPDEFRVFSIRAPNIALHRLVYFLNKTGKWDFCNIRHLFSPMDSFDEFFVFRHDAEVDHIQWFFAGKNENAEHFLVAVGPGAKHLPIEATGNLLSDVPEVFIAEHLPMVSPSGRKSPYFTRFTYFLDFLSIKKQILTWE